MAAKISVEFYKKHFGRQILAPLTQQDVCNAANKDGKHEESRHGFEQTLDQQYDH